MKREIKFRAWDKRMNKFLWPYPEGFNVIGEVTAFDLIGQQLKESTPYIPVLERIADIELLQYTGLKDKNGKEIFDGDIRQDKLFVKWNQLHCCFGWFSKNGMAFEMMVDQYDGNGKVMHEWQDLTSEIIGSIYENPELL